jgi:glucose-6-phosphate isomerase
MECNIKRGQSYIGKYSDDLKNVRLEKGANRWNYYGFPSRFGGRVSLLRVIFVPLESLCLCGGCNRAAARNH